jgi:hypothetical protein
MAKREQRKTSLGNVFESSTTTKRDTPPPPPPVRWRSASESSAQLPRPKLFRSVREAMEFEAAEEEEKVSREATRTMTTTRTLDARTLSTLENTQADQAGYTVIRRRAISEPSQVEEKQARPGSGRSGVATERHRGKPSRERRRESSEGRARGGATGSAATMRSTRRQSKRSATSGNATPSSVPAPSTRATSAGPNSTGGAGEEQRWLAAASVGAVVPAGAANSATGTSSPLVASGSSAWASPCAAALTARATSPSSPLEEAEEEMPPAPPKDAALDASMLSWLERALALDETRAPSSPARADA